MSSKSHLGEGWQGQWDRVGRWHGRLDRIRGSLPDAEPEKMLALDDVFAFFMKCSHLRDWLIGSGEKGQRSGRRLHPEERGVVDLPRHL